jgi:hypothetical protein
MKTSVGSEFVNNLDNIEAIYVLLFINRYVGKQYLHTLDYQTNYKI